VKNQYCASTGVLPGGSVVVPSDNAEAGLVFCLLGYA